MTWNDKFNTTAIKIDEDESIENDFYLAQSGADDSSIAKFRESCPFIPASYVDFLSVTDGADIAQCTFFATQQGEFADHSTGAIGYETYPKSNWLIVGHDAGGNPIMIYSDGRVAVGEAKARAESQHRIIATDFDEFLNDVLMGEKYAQLYGSDPRDDPWFEYLVAQGWA